MFHLGLTKSNSFFSGKIWMLRLSKLNLVYQPIKTDEIWSVKTKLIPLTLFCSSKQSLEEKYQLKKFNWINKYQSIIMFIFPARNSLGKRRSGKINLDINCKFSKWSQIITDKIRFHFSTSQNMIMRIELIINYQHRKT